MPDTRRLFSRWFIFLYACCCLPAFASQSFYDRTHPSKVFGELRNYRILLPPDYESSGKAYPVIYYFHAHSDRYTVRSMTTARTRFPRWPRLFPAMMRLWFAWTGMWRGTTRAFMGARLTMWGP